MTDDDNPVSDDDRPGPDDASEDAGDAAEQPADEASTDPVDEASTDPVDEASTDPVDDASSEEPADGAADDADDPHDATADDTDPDLVPVAGADASEQDDSDPVDGEAEDRQADDVEADDADETMAGAALFPTAGDYAAESETPGDASTDDAAQESDAPFGAAFFADDEGPTADEEPKKKSRARRALLWSGAALVVVLGALYGLGYYFTGERLPANTQVADVDVSGLSPSAAETRLADELAPLEETEISLYRDDFELGVAPENAGLAWDPEASVSHAGGERSWDPRDMVRLVFGEDEHDPVVTYDDELMHGQLDSIASELDDPEVEPLITFADGEPEVRDPEPGFRVDRDALTDLIADTYLRSEEPQEIPMGDVDPAVTDEAVNEALESYAEPAMSAPVTLEVDDTEVDLEPSVYESSLRMEVLEGDDVLTPTIDPEELADPLADATSEIGEPARDAQIVLEGGSPTIVESESGRGVEPEELADLLIDVLDESGDARRVSVEVREVEPAFTTEDAEELGVVEQVSTFTTYYPPAAYRDTNQGRAAELINGTLLKPGEEFSMNGVVGERTAANGFVEGIVISGGRFDSGMGGGVSQVATTVYNAAYFAGLEFKEFGAHSVYIDRYPKGREATVAWGSLDLRFENNTPYGILIAASVRPSSGGGQGEMTVSMYSTEHWEIESQTGSEYNRRTGRTIEDSSPDCQGQAPTAGFDIDVTRIWKQSGETIRTETETTVYNAADRIVCVPPPSSDDDDDD